MIKFFLLIFFCCPCFFARCQNKASQIPAATLSAGVEAVIPSGNMNTISSFGLGASVKTTTPFASFAGATISGGYTHYFGKDNYGHKFKSLTTFPWKGGIRLFTKSGFYAEPQVGYTVFTSGSVSEVGLSYAFNIGCIVRHVDVSLKYEAAMLQGIKLPGSGLRIAYVF